LRSLKEKMGDREDIVMPILRSRRDDSRTMGSVVERCLVLIFVVRHVQVVKWSKAGTGSRRAEYRGRLRFGRRGPRVC
jgi:hypothetical protein